MSHEFINPAPVKHKYFTPGVIVLIIIAINGLVFLMGRFFFGLGAVTNLNNQYPWGLWIGVDVAAGVALAAGGFTTAALGHVMHRDEYAAIVRPALLTAMLGYTFVALGVFVQTHTLAAPAPRSTRAQALVVAPVVNTSSSKITCFPFNG